MERRVSRHAASGSEREGPQRAPATARVLDENKRAAGALDSRDVTHETLELCFDRTMHRGLTMSNSEVWNEGSMAATVRLVAREGYLQATRQIGEGSCWLRCQVHDLREASDMGEAKPERIDRTGDISQSGKDRRGELVGCQERKKHRDVSGYAQLGRGIVALPQLTDERLDFRYFNNQCGLQHVECRPTF